jgi:DNA-binding winged helix-turn-helix (wHTH) protein
MSEQVKESYGFGPFALDVGERRLLRDGEPVQLPPKAFDLLVVLVRRQGRLVRKEELLSEVWPDTLVEEGNLSYSIHLVRKALDGGTAAALYIETVPKQGYRFVPQVEKLSSEVATPEVDRAADAEEGASSGTRGAAAEPLNEISAYADAGGTELTREDLPRVLPPGLTAAPDASARLFGGHLCHVLASCALYALLYTVALLVEVAYQFDRLGAPAMRIAPWVFGWIMLTSVAGLAADWRWARRGKAKGLAVCLLVFVGAAVALYVALGMFLPGAPVTEARFQTYTAHGAYLKSVYYFLPLAVLFLILPFHFVVSTQGELQAGRARIVLDVLLGVGLAAPPAGSIYLKVRWLGLALTICALVSVAVLAHLFENLLPNEHLNLFIQSVQWRTLLYFGLGLECMVWYYHSLGRIRRKCLALSA